MASRTQTPEPGLDTAKEQTVRLRGMDRSFAFLEYIASSPSRVVDVTKAFGLPWATVHRTLTQLEKAQFLRKDPETNQFKIGPRLWHIGSAYLSNHPVLNAAMSDLSQEDGIDDVAVQLVERIGFTSVVIYAAQRLTEKITKAHYGFHFPLHCGSKGHVLLAYETPEFIDHFLDQKLEVLTNKTITDPDELRAILKDTREKGFALTIADVQPFTGSVSAPIRDSSGKVVACLTYVFLKKFADSEPWLTSLEQRLIHTSHSISFNLGWRPGQS